MKLIVIFIKEIKISYIANHRISEKVKIFLSQSKNYIDAAAAGQQQQQQQDIIYIYILHIT
mgnify:CR=1 FL=1